MEEKKEADGDGFFITVHLLVVQKHSPSMGIGSADRGLNRFYRICGLDLGKGSIFKRGVGRNWEGG
jgi:hypothetical protein